LLENFKNTEKISLKDKAYQNIRSEIIKANFLPGTFLTEEKLSKWMKISRGPIREALSKIEKEGFVTIIPNRGTMVSNITVQEVNDIFKIRKLLEPVAAKNSLPKILKSELEEAKKDSLKFMSRPENKENRNEFFILDKRFHSLLNKKCDNKKLIELLNNFEDYSYWFINLHFKNYPFIKFIKDHLAIIEAIEKNSEDLVVKTVIQHLENVINSLISEAIY